MPSAVGRLVIARLGDVMKLSTICEEMYSLTCPHCNIAIRPANPIPDGKKVRCPKCAETFTAKGGTAPEKAQAAKGKLTRAQADGFLKLVREKLVEKCLGTLERLKNNPKSTPDYYNRANVHLMNYVSQIEKIWADFFKGLVSEAQQHSLGSIYQGLFDYSKQLYQAYVEKLGVEGGDTSSDDGAERYAYGRGEDEKRLQYHKVMNSGAGLIVTPLTWLHDFMSKRGAKRWLSDNKLRNSAEYFAVQGLEATFTDLSAEDQQTLKKLVNLIYNKLVAAGAGMRKG